MVLSSTGRVIALRKVSARRRTCAGSLAIGEIYTEVVRADVSDEFVVLGRFPQSSPGMSQQVLGDVVPRARRISRYPVRSSTINAVGSRVLTGPESCLDIVDEHLPGGQRSQPIVRGKISLSSMDPSISHCGAGVCCEAVQRLLFELTEAKVRGPTDEPGTQPSRLAASSVGTGKSATTRAAAAGASIGPPLQGATADVPMQHSRNIVVRRQLDLDDVHIGERTRVLGRPPQNPRLIQVFVNRPTAAACRCPASRSCSPRRRPS